MMHVRTHNMVDRQAAARLYPLSTVSQQMLQVELDLGPALRSPGPGPSPLSSSAASRSANNSTSCITIVAGESAFQPQSKSVKVPLGTQSSWRQKAEDVLWLASAFFILFFGDFRSNFFSLLATDPRISRAPLIYGTACVLLNCTMLLLLLVGRSRLKRSGTWALPNGVNVRVLEEYVTAAASAVCAILGLTAYVMLSIALWPVWYFLTIPLLFTLFMALVVLSSYAPQPWSSLEIAQDTSKDVVMNAWSWSNLRSSFKA